MAFGLLLIVALPWKAGAQGAIWSEPVRVSKPIANQIDWFPSVAADDVGAVHVVWNATPGSEGDKLAAAPDATGQLAYVRWDGSSWTRQTDIALIWFGYPARNSLVVDRAGVLHLVYKGWDDPAAHRGQDLWYTRAPGADADTYAKWSKPVRVNSGSLPYFPVLRIDSHGVIHALWTENDPSGKWSLYYAHSRDNGASWTKRVALEDSEPVWWFRVQMVIDTRDAIHVVFELGGQDETSAGLNFGTTRGAAYATSSDSGQTWSKRLFAGPATNSDLAREEMLTPGPQQPAIGVDGNDTRLLVYREYGTNRIVYRESADGLVWSQPAPLPGIRAGVPRPYDVYDMVTDSVGHVHLVAVGYAVGSDSMSVLHSEWSGATWSRPETIASGPPYPEYARVALGQGNRLHVVWFGADRPTPPRSPIGIWYSTAVTAAPYRLGMLGAAPHVPAPAPETRGAAPDTVPASAFPTPIELTADARLRYAPVRSTAAFGELDEYTVDTFVAALVAAGAVLSIVLTGRVWRRPS